MTTAPFIQKGSFSRCELNVLVDMFIDGHEAEYIAEVLCRAVDDVKKQVKFKGLEKIKTDLDNSKRLKQIVEKHCGAAA